MHFLALWLAVYHVVLFICVKIQSIWLFVCTTTTSIYFYFKSKFLEKLFSIIELSLRVFSFCLIANGSLVCLTNKGVEKLYIDWYQLGVTKAIKLRGGSRVMRGEYFWSHKCSGSFSMVNSIPAFVFWSFLTTLNPGFVHFDFGIIVVWWLSMPTNCHLYMDCVPLKMPPKPWKKLLSWVYFHYYYLLYFSSFSLS